MTKNKKKKDFKMQVFDVFLLGYSLASLYLGYYVFGSVFVISFFVLALVIGNFERLWRSMKCRCK